MSFPFHDHIPVISTGTPLENWGIRDPEETLRRCNGMAGGVFLAAALVHLLPDAQEVPWWPDESCRSVLSIEKSTVDTVDTLW
jgi:hypothetical protein